MNLSEFKSLLKNLPEIQFINAEGQAIEKHFHITEFGQIHKKFIDCGNQLAEETFVTFQMWVSDDTQHHLTPQKLLAIIEKSEKTLDLLDADIEIEYQDKSISKYGLEFKENAFVLTSKQTDCRAKDICLRTEPKRKIQMQALGQVCEPGSGCC
jgi:hypothetical protein